MIDRSTVLVRVPRIAIAAGLLAGLVATVMLISIGERDRPVAGLRRAVGVETSDREERVALVAQPHREAILEHVPRAGIAASKSNAHAHSVAVAYRSGLHPERLSSAAAPKPFDLEAFEEDPGSYLNTIEPGRAYQGLRPGKGVPVLRNEGAPVVAARQGERVHLRVRAVPHAPVAFLATAGGTFERSQLNSVTVRADDRGVAEAGFVAGAGTVAFASILAGSPQCAGDVQILVRVRAPRDALSIQPK